MEIGHIIPHIEALIFASDRPLTAIDITELVNNAFGFMEDKITIDQVSTALEGIIEKYRSEFYPFEMRETGGGWQFLTKKEFHKTVAQLNGEKFLKRLSTAALETLAIIAYKQPITKADIEAIRGVSSDYSIQKLLEKELIVITGRNEELPGKPLVYATSKSFMDYFGLNSPDELPKLKEVFDEAMATPTMINEEPNTDSAGNADEQTAPEEEAGPGLIVNETGELAEPGAESVDEADEEETADGIDSVDENKTVDEQDVVEGDDDLVDYDEGDPVDENVEERELPNSESDEEELNHDDASENNVSEEDADSTGSGDEPSEEQPDKE